MGKTRKRGHPSPPSSQGSPSSKASPTLAPIERGQYVLGKNRSSEPWKHCMLSPKQIGETELVQDSDGNYLIAETGLRIWRELIETEVFYQDDLDYVLRPEVLEAVQSSKDQDLKNLFRKLQDIRNFQNMFFSMLQTPNPAQWEVAARGLRNSYGEYSKLYQIIANSTSKDRDALSTKFFPEKGMSHYLVMPIQRLPRYVLLGNELVKNRSPHFRFLVNGANEAAKAVNENIRVYEYTAAFVKELNAIHNSKTFKTFFEYLSKSAPDYNLVQFNIRVMNFSKIDQNLYVKIMKQFYAVAEQMRVNIASEAKKGKDITELEKTLENYLLIGSAIEGRIVENFKGKDLKKARNTFKEEREQHEQAIQAQIQAEEAELIRIEVEREVEQNEARIESERLEALRIEQQRAEAQRIEQEQAAQRMLAEQQRVEKERTAQALPKKTQQSPELERLKVAARLIEALEKPKEVDEPHPSPASPTRAHLVKRPTGHISKDSVISVASCSMKYDDFRAALDESTQEEHGIEKIVDTQIGTFTKVKKGVELTFKSIDKGTPQYKIYVHESADGGITYAVPKESIDKALIDKLCALAVDLAKRSKDSILNIPHSLNTSINNALNKFFPGHNKGKYKGPKLPTVSLKEEIGEHQTLKMDRKN